ncbi:MAG: DUF115 domain-containing protein [Treponema sp.]|jgi:hypothetical protein|nr:DUF115 domain-containing protein [Treponema sp.]
MGDPRILFEGNLAALRDRELAARLAAQRPDFSAPVSYRFLEARNGDPVPALYGAEGRSAGPARPLHSLFDPRREGERLIAALEGEDFLVFLGLGGAYQVEAALARSETDWAVIVEFGLRGFAELLGLRDLRGILADDRVRLLVDPRPGVLERLIPDLYLPVLSKALRVLPLRPRVEGGEFAGAAEEVRRALGRISADYSVQAHFGIRMFKNTLRNILRAEGEAAPLPRIRRAAVCAAGPSLDSQIPRLAEARRQGEAPFLIATDTSLPALLCGALEPDAVISIDCQHISYRHFIPPGVRRCSRESCGIPPASRLFLDLASPPPLASLAARPVFFSAGHPLGAYISSRWRPFPQIDGSGGNVTYAAVSLAEALGAAEIELYGADFSYPQGRTYARGTYLFPYFDTLQNRFEPLEALFSRFLYRSPLEKRILPREPDCAESAGSWYYETETLVHYRESLEAAGERMRARLIPADGLGAPIVCRPRRDGESPAAAPCRTAAVPPVREFLAAYREKIRALPPPAGTAAGLYLAGLGDEGRRILSTLLPLAAALRQKEPGTDLIERTRSYSIAAIDRVLGV